MLSLQGKLTRMT